MLGRIAEAERRANEAEERARHAVAKVSEPTPEPESPPQPTPEAEPAGTAERSEPGEPGASAAAVEPEAFLPPNQTAQSDEPTVITPPTPAPEPESGAPQPLQGGGTLSLNEAGYEDLRSLGLSVTQTGRVLAYRERVGGFSSLDDLEAIPGFPRSLLNELRAHLRL
jgi:hypothetical protein